MGLRVLVGVRLGVRVGYIIVIEGIGISVIVWVAVGVFVFVGVMVTVGVLVDVGIGVADRKGMRVLVGVRV